MASKAVNKRDAQLTSPRFELEADVPSKATPEARALAGLHDLRGLSRTGVAWEVYRGDVRTVLASFRENRFGCVVTSPPYYWQRDYAVEGQIGQESTIEQYVSTLVDSMDKVRRVLRGDGVLFLNLGDTYYSAKGLPKGNDRKNKARRFGLRAVDTSGLGVPRKTIIGIPWRVALRMIESGWILRSPIVWRREGSIPEPTAHDRPWRTYEMVFMFTKSQRYNFDRRGLEGEEDIWTISARPKPSNGLHAAAFPDELVERCLRVGCPAGSEVLDPFAGTGTVLRVAVASGRPATGIDLSLDFCQFMAKQLDTL